MEDEPDVAPIAVEAMTTGARFVTWGRWTLAAIIVVGTAGLMIWSRATTGFGHRGVQYFIMGVWFYAGIVIPAVLALDHRSPDLCRDQVDSA